ncbi:MAG TPA: DUF554 domain-containing protein [Spirochaetia bacterium]|nr:DUF554 domain-containing protein [Spirochaetia bacterium]
MIATVVNALAVIAGSLLGLLLHGRIKESFKTVVYVGAGVTSLIIGIQMAMSTQKIVFLALSMLIGGILGTWWRIEDGIMALGETLKRAFIRGDHGKDFAFGFLNASVLFCVGAMALVGSFKAGTEHNYDLIFTKSVMDGFMSIVFTAAMGIGVAFSALSVFVYQGLLTVAASGLQPWVSPEMLRELTGVGGALVIMIGINLLGIAKLKTANFLPALLLIVLAVLGEGFATSHHWFGL